MKEIARWQKWKWFFLTNKLWNDFGAVNYCLYTLPFLFFVMWHFYMERFVPFLVNVMGFFNKSFFHFGSCVQKTLSFFLFFSVSFVQKTIQQSDTSCNIQNILGFYANFSKNTHFISANTKGFFWANSTALPTLMSRCNLFSKCGYHILLLGDVEELLQKLDALCFTYI